MKANELNDFRVRVIVDLGPVVTGAALHYPYIFQRLKSCSPRDFIAHILSIGTDSLRNEHLSTELGEMLELEDGADIASVDFFLTHMCDFVTRSITQMIPHVDFDKFVFEDWVDVNYYAAIFKPDAELDSSERQIHDDFPFAEF